MSTMVGQSIRTTGESFRNITGVDPGFGGGGGAHVRTEATYACWKKIFIALSTYEFTLPLFINSIFTGICKYTGNTCSGPWIIRPPLGTAKSSLILEVVS